MVKNLKGSICSQDIFCGIPEFSKFLSLQTFPSYKPLKKVRVDSPTAVRDWFNGNSDNFSCVRLDPRAFSSLPFLFLPSLTHIQVSKTL